MSSDPPRTRDRPGYLQLLPPPAETRAPSGDRNDDLVGYLTLILWEIRGLRFEVETMQSPVLKRRYLPWVQELFARIADAEDRERAAKAERAKLAIAPGPETERPRK